MATSNDESGVPSGEPPISEVPTKFDEVGRRAGAALRRPAPEGGAADIARRSQRRRVATVAASGAIVVVMIGAIAVLRDGDAAPVSPSFTTDGISTVPERDTSTTSVTTPPTTVAPVATSPPVQPATFTPTAVARPMFVSGPVQTVGFSPDGRRIVARLGGAVSVLDAVTGEELLYHSYATFDSPLDDRISTDESRFVLSPDGSLLFDGFALVDTATGAPAFALDLGPLTTLTDYDWRWGQFSADGASLAVMTANQEIGLYDTATGGVRNLDLSAAAGDLLGFTMSAGFDRLVTFEYSPVGPLGGGLDYPRELWDVTPLRPLATLGSGVFAGCFSATGAELVVSQYSGSLEVVDAATGRAISTLGAASSYVATCVGFSPDGSKVILLGPDGGGAAGVASQLQVFDSGSGALLATLPAPGVVTDGYWHPGNITSAAFSPDGGRIVLAPPDGGSSAIVWDLATGQQVATLDGHTGQVVSAAYSPDGSIIVTASVDGTVRLWPAP